MRRTRLSVERVSADTRSRRRRTVPKDQLTPADAGLCDQVFAYSFILTNLDVATPREPGRGRVLVPPPHRHRGPEQGRQDRVPRYGTYPRAIQPSTPCGCGRRCWRARCRPWLQEITGIDHGNGRGRRTITRLRRELICIPGRVIDHARRLELRLPPGTWLLPDVLTRLRRLPAPT